MKFNIRSIGFILLLIFTLPVLYHAGAVLSIYQEKKQIELDSIRKFKILTENHSKSVSVNDFSQEELRAEAIRRGLIQP